jgi:hypothetical protein
VISNGGPPVVVYAGPSALRQADELTNLGAFGASADAADLRTLVRQALGRQPVDRT